MSVDGFFEIAGSKVLASDQRGLMYGLLEAAEQIRGIRYCVHNSDLEQNWYSSHDYWDELFAMLARNRFNLDD